MSTIPSLARLTIAGVNTTDGRGLVSQSLMLAPLSVRISRWDPPPVPGQAPHVLTLIGESGGVETQLASLTLTTPPPADPNFTYELFISLEYMHAAPFRVVRLYYTVTTNRGLNRNSMRPSIPITFDRDPPRRILTSDALQFVVPPIPVLNEQYLLNNPLVRFSFPPYSIGAVGDRAEFYFADVPNPPMGLPAAGGSLVNFSTTPWTATVDAAAFRNLSNGTHYIFCKFFDENGNFSTRSVGVPFVVGFAAGALPAPTIRPPIYNDVLIKRNDARADEGGGVFVHVETYPGWSAAPAQQIIVYWSGRPTAPQVVTRLPIDIPIPWTTLRGPNAVLAAETVPVRYEIIGLNATPTSSAAAQINVNLTIAGQDHPNAPALLNSTLALVEIVGSSGINTLTVVDQGLPVRVRVRLYDNPVSGERLDLFWNGVGPVASYTVGAGDVAGSVVFFSTVPASVVGAAITAPHSVHYTTTNGFNEQRSPVTVVNARVIQLPPPLVRHTLTNGYLNCNSVPSVMPGVVWFIAADPAILVGDRVDFIWQGFNENNWATQNVNVRNSQSIIWSPANASAGASVVVGSFDTTLLPLRKLASATATYEVWRGGVKVAESQPGRVRVDLTYSTGCYCTPRGIVCN